MQVRGLLIAIVVLGVLAGGVYWSERHKAVEDAKEASGGASKLVSLKDEDVRKIEIRKKAAPAPVVVERDKSNQWQMSSPQNWRVDQDSATGVASAYSGLTYDRIVEEKPADLSGYGLQSPATELTVTGKDGKSRKLLLGDDTPTGGATFAKFADDPKVFTIQSGTKTSLDKSAMDLRDKRLLAFEADKLTRVELTAKGQPVEFGRNAQKEWQIVKPKPQRADNGQVEELVRKLGDVRMDTSVPEADAAKAPASFAAGTRIGVASVTDATGTKTLEVRKKGEEYFAKSSVVDGVFKVANDVGESLNKGLDDFRNKKLFDFGFNEPTSVNIKDGDKAYAFQKKDEKWLANGKQVDPTSVQSLIDKLRDLKATRIAEAGFTTPVIEISVVSDSGKRTEKVLISRTGTTFFAKRDGEPAIYELDSKAVEELQRAAADVKEPPPPTPAPAKK
jgi:hypothetical protein